VGKAGEAKALRGREQVRRRRRRQRTISIAAFSTRFGLTAVANALAPRIQSGETSLRVRLINKKINRKID
tara:strand:- start:71 stop:280 length:210 start_codon:yes stop_codon:yes gene_type:complete